MAHDHDEYSEVEEVAQLRLAAVAALSKIGGRGSAPAFAGLRRLVNLADDDIARIAAAELFDRGELQRQDHAVLEGRGIPHAFRRVSLEKAFSLDVEDVEPTIQMPSEQGQE